MPGDLWDLPELLYYQGEEPPQTLWLTGLESGFLPCLPLSGDPDGSVFCMWGRKVALTFFQEDLGLGHELGAPSAT